jgi:hypothetical protein
MAAAWRYAEPRAAALERRFQSALRNRISGMSHSGQALSRLKSTLRWHWSDTLAGLALLLAVGLGGGLGAGCSSVGKPASPVLGSVEIRGVPIERIRDVTSEVFHDHGYKVAASGWTTLTFEREGSLMNDIAYGNWMGSRIRVRVKATLTELSGGGCKIECSAHLVRNEGEPVEDEVKVNRLHGHKYQKMLHEVAKRLHAPPVKPE